MIRTLKMLVLSLVLGLGLGSCAKEEVVEIRLLHTTDVHGNLFPFDEIAQLPSTGGMARLSTIVKDIRRDGADQLILLDGGDFLQGDPITYYSNYVDTLSDNAIVKAMNYVGYDATTIGNHDIEPGHRVYDRFVKDADFPVLGANAIREDNGEPYFVPYTMIERSGVRIAVLGLVTPAIPQWLPKHLYEGMRFEDIVESAKKWVPVVTEKERPDLFVALIHSGLDNTNADYVENAGRALAQEVEGIDLILMGHDHRQSKEWVKRGEADSVLVINPANHLDRVSDLKIRLTRKGGKVIRREIEADFLSLDGVEADNEFLGAMEVYQKGVQDFLRKPIGLLEQSVEASDALFGPSGYLGVMHAMQLHTMQADISFAAPLSMEATLPSGEVYVRDLFKFAPFSNYLYAMRLSGREIKGYLEHSYAGWAEQMQSKDDHLIRFRADAKPTDRYKTETPTFNFSSAQGIDYIVDVSKPIGERVTILQMSGGEPFDLDKDYRVAVNSYRAGGAGGMLTQGAGIDKKDLEGRILSSSDTDQFFSLMRYMQVKGTVSGTNPKNWQFVPSAWVREASARDRAFLYPNR